MTPATNHPAKRRKTNSQLRQFYAFDEFTRGSITLEGTATIAATAILRRLSNTK